MTGELILSSNTINEARVILNDSYSGTSPFNAITASTTYSTTLSGGTIYSGSTNLSALFGGSGGNLFTSGSGANSIISNNGTNTATGSTAIVTGANNSGHSLNSAVVGGTGNGVFGTTSYNSGIVSGNANRVNAGYAFIACGDSNVIKDGLAAYSGIICGTNNEIQDDRAFIGGGESNTIGGNSAYSAILAGESNEILNGYYSCIGAGQLNSGHSQYSFVTGYGNISTGDYSSVIFGSYNEAAHTNSMAAGKGAKTTANYEIAWAGNSAATSPDIANNTFRFDLVNGNIYLDGNNNAGFADFAEQFEYADGNENNEDRRGFFVSLQNGKIKIGNENVIGIISSTPCFIGDSPMKWSKTYLKDEWGEVIKKQYKIYIIDDNRIYVDNDDNKFENIPNISNPIEKIYTQKIDVNLPYTVENIPVLNPEYKHGEEYILRTNRKEWGVVGLLGKILVKSSQEITSNKVDVDINGMAINGQTYSVLRTAKEYDGNYGIVHVLFK